LQLQEPDMKYVFALVTALVLNAVANLLMKMGAKSVSAVGAGLSESDPLGAVFTVLRNPILITGLLCFGLNAFCYMFALQSKTLQISLAYPVMVGGGYAIIAIVAALAPNLRERLSAGQWVGVALILTGVITVAVLTPKERDGGVTPAPTVRSESPS
jgi:multidrug transporter EmrE-like cation transporter